jgi:hypothetical protein
MLHVEVDNSMLRINGIHFSSADGMVFIINLHEDDEAPMQLDIQMPDDRPIREQLSLILASPQAAEALK